MSNSETRADIIAEMRNRADTVVNGRVITARNFVPQETVEDWADRIEAAAKRERRAYEKLHDCFWEKNAIQSIVRQMLDARDDLRRGYPKEADDLEYYAKELMKVAKSAPAPGNAAAMREALENIRDALWDETKRLYSLCNNVITDETIERLNSLLRYAGEALSCEAGGRLGMKLDAAQQDAIDYALTHRFAIINGPAGSGKTSVIKNIANELGDRAALCAFAGNVAAMREALEAFVNSVEWLCEGDESGRLKRQFGVLLSAARAALAAPARNCDKENCAWDAQVEFRRTFRDAYGNPAPSGDDAAYWPLFVNWLFAPARKEAQNGTRG